MVNCYNGMFQGDLEDIMEELDTDQNGGVDFSEFLQFMTRRDFFFFFSSTLFQGRRESEQD